MVDRVKPCRPVKTKADFYRRFHAGEFGNHGPMWQSLDEYMASGYRGPIAIRTKKRGGRCDYWLSRKDVPRIAREFEREGWGDINFSAMSPHKYNTLQGEIHDGPRGVEGMLSEVKGLPMRPAMADHSFASFGLECRVLLRSSMTIDDYEHLIGLLDRYPGHVVEFAAFSVPWGVIPGMRTVIWEVRHY